MTAQDTTQAPPAENTAIEKNEPLHIYMRRPEVLEKFIGLFPSDKAANRFIQSVLILVQLSDPGEYSLQNCSNTSVLRSALRAASLRVSVDPAVRQAWLVPRKNRKTGKIEANLQLHYIEICNRAMRTNRYRCINVGAVYEGETVLQDIYSGLHRVMLKGGLITVPGDINGFVPVSERRGKYIGWLGYDKTTRGAEQTVFMSVDDIEKFVGQHNPYWTTSKAWKENRQTMEQKTVLLALLRKADLGDPEMEEVRQILDEDDVIDATSVDVEQPSEKPAAPVTVTTTTEKAPEPAAEKKPAPAQPAAEKPAAASAQPAPASAAKPAVDPLDEQFPPLPADWQAAKAAKDDAKKEAEKPVEKKAEAAQPAQPAQPATRPYPPALFREKFNAAVGLIEKQNHLDKVGEREQKIVASAIDGIFGGEKTMRYEVCQWLTGHGSTKEMSKGQLRALMVIMGVEEFNVAPKAEAMQELKQAHAQALIDAGQQELLPAAQ